MKKLTTLFAIVTLSTTLGLAGCKKKRDEEAKDNTPAAKTNDMKPDDKAAPKPDEPKKEDTAAAPTADLPAECNEYKAVVEKLATCDKMPKEARDALKQGFDQASATWAKLSGDAKAQLSTACRSGTEAVTTAAKTTCGW
ncbi:MAG: hypothetical protein JWO36_3590 [Myxococcales bacterium]|nr:hypothetical protein [Myxococcales bacterium]